MKSFYKSKEDELIDHLRSFEVNPPDGLWDDIESTLLAKRKRKAFIITSWASAATIALLFTIAGVYTVNHKVETISSGERKGGEISKNEMVKVTARKGIKTDRKENLKIDSGNLDRKVALSSSESNLRVEAEDLTRNDEVPENAVPIQPSVSVGDTTAKAPAKIDIKIQCDPMGQNGSIAQIDLKEKRRKGEWYFSASGFPVYSFHTAGAMNRSAVPNEAGIVTWGGSLAVRYAFSRSVSIEMGLTYNVLGQQERNIYMVSSGDAARSNDDVTFSGFSNSYGQISVKGGNIRAMDLSEITILSIDAVSTTSFSDVALEQRFSYLEFPVLFVRGFKLKGLDFNLKTGLSAGFLIGNKLDLRAANLHLTGKTNGIDPVTASALASIGLSYPMGNHFRLLVVPTFKIGLMPLSTDGSKSYPFSAYIKLGVEVPI